MTGKRLAPVWLMAVIPLLAGCIHYEKTETVGTPIYVRSNFPDCRLRGLALTQPTVGLFVGVSGYETAAGVYSTPAHFIGASLVAGLFGRAGDAMAPGGYAGTSLTDYLQRDRLPKDVTDPSKVVSTMGYGSGGTSEPVSRARIERAITDAIAQAEATQGARGRVQLVIYVAAHGVLGEDGEPYVLPADAAANDPATWIAYRSILASVRAFLARNVPGEPTRTALVIFDTCQVRKGHGTPVSLAATPGLMIVQSAAPGEYAWHWTASNVMDQHVEVVRETRLGVGLGPRQPRGDLHWEVSSTMSVLPLANQCSLAERQRRSTPEAGSTSSVVTAGDWFAEMKRKADNYLAEIPEKQQLNRTQQISMLVTAADARRPLFATSRPVDDGLKH